MLTPYSGNNLIPTTTKVGHVLSPSPLAKEPNHVSRSGGHDFRMFLVGMESLFDSPQKETTFQKILNFVKELFQEMGILERPELELDFEFPRLNVVVKDGNKIEHKTITADELLNYFVRVKKGADLNIPEFEMPELSKTDTKPPPRGNMATERAQSQTLSEEDRMRRAKDVFTQEIGVSKDISFAQCRKEFVRLSKIYHTGRSYKSSPGGQGDAGLKFKNLKESWDAFHTALGEGCHLASELEKIDQRLQKEKEIQPEVAKVQQEKETPIEQEKEQQKEVPLDLD